MFFRAPLREFFGTFVHKQRYESEQYIVEFEVLVRSLTAGENVKETRQPHIAIYWCLHFHFGMQKHQEYRRAVERNSAGDGQ